MVEWLTRINHGETIDRSNANGKENFFVSGIANVLHVRIVKILWLVNDLHHVMIIPIVRTVLLDYSPRNVLHVISRSQVKTTSTWSERMNDVFLIEQGVGGTRYISFEDRHWHNECFVCRQCRTSLVGRGFLTEGPDILCPDCGKRTEHRYHEQPGYTTIHQTISSDYRRID